jgi:eukaryotic-like serine/threonine-protein kinase
VCDYIPVAHVGEASQLFSKLTPLAWEPDKTSRRGRVKPIPYTIDRLSGRGHLRSVMDADRWRRISRLYDEARSRADEERRAFLDSACGDDVSLRQDLDALLAGSADTVFRVQPAAAADTPSPGPGDMLGSHRLERLIGRGGMGAVFLAYDTRLQRQVALKVLEDQANDAIARARLLREARNAAALNHPYICTIHEVGDALGTAFIAMEYVGGRSLRERIDEGPLPLADTLRVGIQAADALAYAHAHGVIHRDFKAGNVILTEDGRLKVVDFGLARRDDPLMASETTLETLVPAGATAGTPYTMAPEQVRGEPMDARTDIWALGVLLYELVTGAPPFKGASVPELFSSILTSAPAPLPDTVPAELRVVIERCLEKEPAHRYAGADEVRAALEAIQAGTVPPWVAWRYHLRRRPVLASAAALLLLAVWLVAANAGGMRDRLVGNATAMAPIKLAVLPFENLTGDAEQEYFSDGLTDEMITQLGRLHPQRLGVIARTSSMRYKNRDAPIDQIGRELGVDYLLEGSARREGTRVRINATLIQVSDQTQRWTDSFDRELAGILSLQNDVARGVAGALALALLPAEEDRLARARSVNPEAYEAFLRGVSQLERERLSNLDSALAYFELALENDPSYALAYVGISRVWLGRQQAGIVPPSESGPKVRAALARALALDDAIPEVHESLAASSTWTDWDWAAAETSFRRAIDLNPNYAHVRAYYSHYLHIMQRPDEAMAQIDRALELDPFNPVIRARAGGAFLMARRYDDALEQFRTVLQMEPGSLGGLIGVANALHAAERFEEAVAAEREMVGAGRGDRELEEILALGYAEEGYEGAMRRAAELLAARSLTQHLAPNRVGRLYLLAGETERALDWLERGYDARDPNLPYIGSDAKEFDAVRSHPRFQALLQRMNLPARTGPVPR